MVILIGICKKMRQSLTLVVSALAVVERINRTSSLIILNGDIFLMVPWSNHSLTNGLLLHCSSVNNAFVPLLQS